MEKTKKVLNLLNIQREKKEIILKEEQEKAVVELLSERRFGYTTDRFRETFDLYDLCFGEHRFAICEDVCVSHLHSILHFSHRHCRHFQMMLLTSQCPNRCVCRVQRMEHFAVIYEFLEKSPNFCFRLLRQSLHYDKVYTRRWRFFP